jgi:hypothetical protein
MARQVNPRGGDAILGPGDDPSRKHFGGGAAGETEDFEDGSDLEPDDEREADDEPALCG